MGLFLAMSGAIQANQESVAEALRAFAVKKDGRLEPEKLSPENDECLILSAGPGGTTVVYPRGFFGWDEASEFLSTQLKKPVFSFHIHDSDLWMYNLYDMGALVDQFNPVPNYWEELAEDEERAWQGNASAIAKRVPGLSALQIEEYLKPWRISEIETGVWRKAYPTDRFPCGNEWQLLDFMAKLGLDYPVDDYGAARGVTYRFVCRTR